MNQEVTSTTSLSFPQRLLVSNIPDGALPQGIWLVVRLAVGGLMIHNGIDKLADVQGFADNVVSFVGLPSNTPQCYSTSGHNECCNILPYQSRWTCSFSVRNCISVCNCLHTSSGMRLREVVAGCANCEEVQSLMLTYELHNTLQDLTL